MGRAALVSAGGGVSAPTFVVRQACPPGACSCERERLLDDPAADKRVLMLTKDEEKKLIARLEAMDSLEDLRKMQAKLQQLLGVTLHVSPGENEVRTVHGLTIELGTMPGLCKRTRQSVPAAIRRCLHHKPHIVYAMLDEQGLFGLG